MVEFSKLVERNVPSRRDFHSDFPVESDDAVVSTVVVRAKPSADPCVVLTQFSLSMRRNKGHGFVEEVPCRGPVVCGFNAVRNTSGILDGARDGESVGVDFVKVDGVPCDTCEPL